VSTLSKYVRELCRVSGVAFEGAQSREAVLSALFSLFIAVLSAHGLSLVAQFPAWANTGTLIAGLFLVTHFVFVAPFRLWRLERARADSLEETKTPKVTLEGPRFVVEPKGAEGPAVREWRLKVRNISASVVRNCSAKKKSFVNAQGQQSDSINACFMLSRERGRPSGHHEYFDIPPGGEEEISIATWNERDPREPVCMHYATPGIRNLIPLTRFPHDLTIAVYAENLAEPVSRHFEIGVVEGRLVMKEGRVPPY
jgi:hypothetical protein